MSLEEAIAENTKATNALIAALAANGGSAPAAAAPAATGAAGASPNGRRPPGRPRTKPNLADVKAMAEKVMAAKGQPAAVAVIREHGAARLAELDESKYAAFIAACEVALSEDDAGDPEPDDSL